MTVEQGIRMMAGIFILASLALGWWVNHWFFLFTAFVGFNLLQSSITRWCPAEKMFAKLGFKK